MFYTVYKITNLINNKYYIGKHQTKKIDDGYMGSGVMLKRAKQKYGLDNFKKEILFIFDNEQEMNDKEKQLVVISEQTYNICEGGKGGFGYINSSVWTEEKRIIHNSNVSPFANSVWREINKIKLSESASKAGKITQEKVRLLSLEERKKFGNGRFKGGRHTEEAKRRIAEANKISQKGSRNSQFGTFWATDGINNKKIKTIDEMPDGWYKGYNPKRK